MTTEPKDLIEAHEAMALVLDAKFPNLPEWRAFRAIDRLLYAALRTPVTTEQGRRQRVRLSDDAPLPYMTLADHALAASGLPLSTTALMDYITAHRAVGDDPKKARIVVQSSLSKHERFRSIPWQGGRAWWYADKPVPKMETASAKPAA
jgi:hypothetical protein